MSFWFRFWWTDICRNVAMVKSSKDTRYAVDAVVTHDGIKFPCWPLQDLLSFKHKIGADEYSKVNPFSQLWDFAL